MAKCRSIFFGMLLLTSNALFAQNGHEQRVRDMVAFLEYFLNTVGDKETSNRDKDVIINESYTKIFRDAQVQIEDDLLEDRQSVINKDVVAYLKDVDFFFTDAGFKFDILKVEQLTRDNGKPFFRVEMNRSLDAISIEGKSVKNTQKRFIEVNLDEAKDDLRIASIYTTKISKDEELMAWWSELSYEWNKIFKILLNTNDEINAAMLHEIAAIDSLNLSGNQYIFNIEPLYVLSNLRFLDISQTRIADLGPLRSTSTLETLIANQSEIYDLEYLKYLRNLSTLDVSNTRIRDIEVIDQFNSLTNLDLSGNYITDFQPLKGLKGLRSLDISSSALSSTHSLSEISGLTSLNLSNTLINNIDGLSGMPMLKELDVSKTDVAGLGALSGSQELEILNINQTRVKTIEPLAQLKKLKRIYCDNTEVTESEATSFMSRNKNVLVINNSQQVLQWWGKLDFDWQKALGTFIAGNKQQPSKEDLVMLLNIDSLSLKKSGLNSSEPLTRFYKLRYLDISENNIRILDPLVNLDKLETLKVSNTSVENVLPLKNLKNLSYLDMSGTRVSDIYLLSYLRNLQYLNVDNANVSWEAIKEFHTEQPSCSIIFDSNYLSNWWQKLSEDWKEVFRKNNDFQGAPDALMLHRIIAQDQVTIDQVVINNLKPLWDFLSLKALYISNSSLSDLTSLPALVHLEVLECKQLPLENIAPIGSLSSLRELNISNTATDDLRPLATLSKLEVLNCSGTNVSNLRGLENLVSLSKLDCSNTRVNRLDQIFGLDNLNELSCYNTRLNQRDISGFQSVNPDCKIIYY